MKHFLLAFICLLVIGGVFYGGIYTERKYGNSVQAITVNEKVAKAKEVLEIKAKDETIAKYKEEVAETTLNEKKSQVKSDETKKNSNSNSQKVIVIDPGHSSIVDLATEPEAPGSKTMKIKEPGGGHGIITKTQSKQVLGSIARAEVGNKAKANLVIRIHADSSDNTSASGATMLVPKDTKYTDPIYKTSKNYGQIIFNNLIKNVGMNSRGVVEKSDMTGFNWSKVPVILVEMGFQSNVNEDKLLTTDSYQVKIAKGLAGGIDEALK